MVLGLQGADNGDPQLLPQAPGQPNKKNIGEVDNVRLQVVPEPPQQLLDLLGLVALFALEHGTRKGAEPGGFGAHPHRAQ